MKKIRYYIGTALGIVFLLQALKIINLIPIEIALEFFGQSTNPLIIFSSIFLSAVILFTLVEITKSAQKNHAVYLNEIINIVGSRFSINFLGIWISFFTYSFFVPNPSFESFSNPIFLNYFLFWAIIASTFIEPKGMTIEEQKKFEKQESELKEKLRSGEISLIEYIKAQQEFAKKELGEKK